MLENIRLWQKISRFSRKIEGTAHSHPYFTVGGVNYSGGGFWYTPKVEHPSDIVGVIEFGQSDEEWILTRRIEAIWGKGVL